MATAGPACEAYKRLDERLSQSYESYRRLRQDGKLGQDSDMYETNTDCDNEMKPSIVLLQIIFVVESSVQWQPLKRSLKI